MHDRISGTLTRAWRLDMAPPTQLGRVAVVGTDQFITRLAADTPAGVEIRAGALSLDADSRLDGARDALPAVGWLHDFQSRRLNCSCRPDGVAARDRVDQRARLGRHWTLLDLFVVLTRLPLSSFVWRVACSRCSRRLTYKTRRSGRVWLSSWSEAAAARPDPARARLLHCARRPPCALAISPCRSWRAAAPSSTRARPPRFSIDVGAARQATTRRRTG